MRGDEERPRQSENGGESLRAQLAGLRDGLHNEVRRREPGFRTSDGLGAEAYLDVVLISRLFSRYLHGIGLKGLQSDLPGFLGFADPAVLNGLGAVGEEFEKGLAGFLPGKLAIEELLALSAPFHDEADRKHWGKFYTPKFIVDHILDHTLEPQLRADGSAAGLATRLLEPSCGAGDFVLPAYDRFARAYSREGIDPLAAHHAILERNLFALDTDPAGVALTRMSLALKCEPALRESGFPRLNVHRANALLVRIRDEGPMRAKPERESKSEPGSQLSLLLGPTAHGDRNGVEPDRSHAEGDAVPISIDGMRANGFDVVVGNPPFGAKLSRDLVAFFRRRYSVVFGKVETAALFLERGLDLASQRGGAIGLVMPHSFSRSGAYRKARDLLLDRAVLTTLVDLGCSFQGVSFNTMAFTATRGGKKARVSLCEVEQPGRIRCSSRVPQDFFLGRDTLPMHVPTDWLGTLQSIELRAEPLRRVVKIERGENIKGRRSLLGWQNGAGRLPVVRGADVKPYAVLERGNLPSVSTEAAPPPPSRFPEIVIQNISNVIEATLMPSGMLPLDTVNLLWMKDDRIEKEYIVGLLNSRFLGFYFRNCLINRATLTIHLDDPTLGGLPIIVASPTERRKVVKAVTDLYAARRKASRLGSPDTDRERLESRASRLQKRVDDLVDGIYGLTEAMSRRVQEDPASECGLDSRTDEVRTSSGRATSKGKGGTAGGVPRAAVSAGEEGT